MRQVKFFATLAVAASVLLLSCNSGEEKKASDTPTDTSTVKKDSVAIPSGPTSVMTVTHKVANYAKWKSAYDGHDSARVASGLHNYAIARGLDDSNMVMVVLRMDDVNKAKELANSKEMKDRMKKGGVTGPASIDYAELVLDDTTAIQQTVRLKVTHKVKDWDAWKKSFDEDKKVRVDAGLTDRVVGHTVGDNHNVTVVFAVADVEKAKAFIKSKELKDKMDAAGVDGPPSFFFYHIAAKY
jgi:hypothetical protein